jgi:hypothetical protein
MKKKTLFLSGLAMLAMLPFMAKATNVTGVDVTNTSSVQFQAAECYNGNWLASTCLGCPAYPNDSDKVAAEKKMGRQFYLAIVAQTKNRDEAKAKGPQNYKAIAAAAFWTSNVAWAYNNAAYAMFGSEKDTKTFAKAEAILTEGLDILNGAGDLGKGVNAAQTAAFASEVKNRAKVKSALEKNLLYAQRVLGEKPWPDTGKKVKKSKAKAAEPTD